MAVGAEMRSDIECDEIKKAECGDSAFFIYANEKDLATQHF